MTKFLSGKDLDLAITDISDTSNELAFQTRLAKFPNALVGVAEGDSWFDYLPSWAEDPKRGDLINQLNRYRRGNGRKFNILRIAKAGDTLENMIYGSDLDFSGRPEKRQFTVTLSLIKKYQPAFFLFSGGGNDIVGEELASILNHIELEKELGLVRLNNIKFILDKVFKQIFDNLISEIIQTKPDIQIFLHGYGYAIPNGKPVIGVPSYGFIGPWMAPTFAKKRIPLAKGEVIIRELIDLFNDLLIEVANAHPNVHYLDLRKIIQPNDWANELHLTVDGYEKVAREYINRLDSVFTGNAAPNITTSQNTLSTSPLSWTKHTLKVVQTFITPNISHLLQGQSRDKFTQT